MVSTTAAWALGAAVILSGCGGGGGGSGEATLPELNLPAAAPTVQNAEEAIGIVGEAPPMDDMVEMLTALLAEIGGVTMDIPATPVPCDTGTATVSGSTTSTSADLTVKFDDCVFGTEGMNGTVRMMALGNMAAQTLSSMSVKFPTTFTMTMDTTAFVVTAGSLMDANFTAFSDSYIAGTQSSSLRWSVDGQSGGYDDLTIGFEENLTADRSEECYQNGTLYINNMSEELAVDESYDANCSDPFVTESGGLVSGSMRLVGDGGTVDLNVTGTNEITVTDANGSITVNL